MNKMAKLTIILGVFCIARLVLSFTSSSSTVVNPSLLQKVAAGQTANIVIVIKNPVSSVCAQYHGKSYPQRGHRMTAMRQSLIDYTAQTQAPVRSFLQSKGVSFTASWITNRIFVRNAEESLILELSSTLRSSIEEIREEIVAQLGRFEPVFVNKTAIRVPVQGVDLVGAPVLWKTGNTGEGIIVANIDSGVLGTHEILSSSFIGEYGWYDPENRTEVPTDSFGHGTHTMGTIAGQGGYGIAPGAKWMACDGCGAVGCYERELIGCAEFIVCPHLPDGSKPDCSKAPHVCSVSWTTPHGGLSWFDDAIATMKLAGVIPVFSAGNDGSSCRTIGTPADRDVIAVAATDFEDNICDFSSRGPSVDGRAKPDISAPGVNVISSWNFGDEAYVALSGTSMACPHVSGAVALLISGNSQLAGDYEAVRSTLLDNAKQTGLTGPGQSCSGVPDSTFPNPFFGHGRLDIPASAGIN